MLAHNARLAEHVCLPMLPSRAALLRNTDPHAVFVVAGASRGIGLAMVRELLGRTRGRVVAAVRSPTAPAALSTVAARAPRERLLVAGDVDMAQPDSMDAFVIDLERQHGIVRVDALLNTVGVLHGRAPASSTDSTPERSLRQLDLPWLEHSLRINTMGPLLLLRAMAPLLRTRGTERPPSVAAILSARVGSISDNGLGGWYSYRMSKAALNMGLRTAALELRRQGTAVLALHPGTVKTDLSAPFVNSVRPDKLLSPERSASNLLDVIDARGDPHLEDRHQFFDFRGDRVEW